MSVPASIINQQLIQQGLAAGAPVQAPQAPTLFDQISPGIFAPGVADPDLQNRLNEELGGFLGEGVFGKRGQRIRRELSEEQFSRDVEAADLFFEQAGVSIPDEQRDAVLQSGFGMAGLQQLAAQAQQQTPQAQALREQAAQRSAEIAEGQRLRNEQTSLANAEALNITDRAAQTFRIDNQSDFQDDVQGNLALSKGQQSLVSYQQLENLLLNPDATALDVQNGIVALAQILEPGLAVRNDDRIAITGGATPGLQRLVQDFNQFVSGDPNLEITKQNMLASGRQLIAPRAESFQEAVRFYEDRIIPNTPGTQRGDTLRILGLTDEIMNTVLGLELQQQQERPRLNQPNVQLDPLPGQGQQPVITRPDGVRDFGTFE